MFVEDSAEETSHESGEPSVVTEQTVHLLSRPEACVQSSFEGLSKLRQGDRQKRFTFFFTPVRGRFKVAGDVDRAVPS